MEELGKSDMGRVNSQCKALRSKLEIFQENKEASIAVKVAGWEEAGRGGVVGLHGHCVNCILSVRP